MTSMQPFRQFAAIALFASTGIVAGQTLPPAPPPPPLPPQSEAMPDVGVPPPFVGDSELEPQVTIKKSKDGATVEEARVNGRLVWIKVTPNHGRPYYLIPDTVNGVYIRRDGYDSGLRVPLWELFSF